MGQRQIGAVIVFGKGVTPAEVERVLEEMAMNVEIEQDIVREFDPEYGEPVWYIP